jgi:carbonic anhydrase
MSIDTLLERNKQAVAKIKEKDPNFFNELAKPQQPKFLYFGCSDARIAADTLLGLKPGEVFVHRNLGNCVPGNDLNALSVLEYAVSVLDVQHIIVGGHYDCGAVRAAMSRKEHGLMENWFRGIRDVYRLHVEELDAIKDLEQRHRRFVELNVKEQCLNLFKTSVVQAKRLKTYQDESIPFTYPRIHGVTFDPTNGFLNRLPLDFKKAISDFQHIYNLYDSPEVEKKKFTKSSQSQELNTSETG